MLHFKRVLKAILFVVIFLLLSKLMSMAMMLKETKSEAMLERYSDTKEIDTIILGNSVAETLAPEVLDERLGYHTFNMATPDQSYRVGAKEVKMVASQHPLKRVILYTTFDAGINSGGEIVDKIYERTVDSAGPLPKVTARKITKNMYTSLEPEMITTEESVNLWLPWTSEVADSWESAWGNARSRGKRLLRGERLGSQIHRDLTEVVYPVVDRELTGEEWNLLHADLEEMHSLSIPDGMMTDEELTELAELCALCSENGIELAVLISPHRTDYYDRYDGYREYTETVDEYLSMFVSERGHVYYNFEHNEDLHEILPDESFMDFEHIHEREGAVATGLIADVLSPLF